MGNQAALKREERRRRSSQIQKGRARNGWPRVAQESRDGSGRESASDDASASLCRSSRSPDREQTRLRPPAEPGPGYQFPRGGQPAPCNPERSPLTVPTPVSLRSSHCPGERAPTSPRLSLPGSRGPRRRWGTKASLSVREQTWPTRARGRWATPPHPSPGHEVPGDGELGPLFPHKVERLFFTNPTPERNQGHVSPAGRTHDSGLSEGMCSAVGGGKKSIVF